MPELTSGGSLLGLSKIARTDAEPNLVVVGSVAKHDRTLDDGTHRGVVRRVYPLAWFAHVGNLDQAEAACSPTNVEEEAEPVVRHNQALDGAADSRLPDELVPLVICRSDAISVRCPLVRAHRHDGSIEVIDHERRGRPGAEWVTN